MQAQNPSEPELLCESKSKSCGCYVKGVNKLGFQEFTRMIIPLKTIEYDISIVDSLSYITLIQSYVNPTHRFLEIEYCFPIFPKSCIYRFVAEFDQQRIEGVVKQKQQAEKQYLEAVKEGRQAAYGEINPQSIDIFNMDIGNIPPKSKVTVQISIMQQLELSQSTFYKLYVPSKITPRYASHHFESIRKLHQKPRQGQLTWTFKINLRASKQIVFHQSSSHKLELINKNESKTQCLFVMTQECTPDRDFTFVFTMVDIHLPSYVLGRCDLTSSGMISFIPKFCYLNMDDAYKVEIANKPMPCDIKSAKGEYIFLIDRSGSMDGLRIQKATEALTIFLKSLPPDCYFNVISFGSYHRSMFQKSSKYNNKQIQKALTEVRDMTNDMGGTAIFQPLTQILQSEVIKGYPKQIFILTDGGVYNTEECITLVKKNIKFSRVHGIGIGQGASVALLQGCAQHGRGKHVMISEFQNVSEKVIEVLVQSLSPVISQIELKYDTNLVHSVLPNPKSIPYILKNDPINFFLSFKGHLSEQTEFVFSYTDSRNLQRFSSTLVVDPELRNQPIVDKMTHYKLIKTLQNIQKYDLNPQETLLMEVKKYECKKLAIQESMRHQILSEYTAFVCVGKQLVDGQYQEFLNKGVEQTKVEQNMRDNSFSMSSIKGIAASNYNSSRRHPMYQAGRNIKLCSASTKTYKASGCCSGGGGNYSSNKPSIQSKNSQKCQQSVEKPSDIIQVVKSQNADGSWTNYDLLVKIIGKKLKQIQIFYKVLPKDIVLTYFFSKWIEKYHPQKQYQLIVQKATEWLQQQITNNSYGNQPLLELQRLV